MKKRLTKKEEGAVETFADRLAHLLVRQVEETALRKEQGVSHLSHSEKSDPDSEASKRVAKKC